MNKSNYSLILKFNENIIAVSFLTGYILKLNEGLYNKLVNNRFNEIENKVLERLIEYGIVENEEGEHLNIIQKNFERIKFSSNYKNLYITLITTYDCNFKCTYCYYGDHKPIKSYIQDNLIKPITRFINDRLKNNENIDRINIEFYGGEPLLNYKYIIKFIDFFEKHVSREVSLSYSITTNGSILNNDIINLFSLSNFNEIQITIDGPPSIHDRFRMFRNGRGTFNTIFSNLLLLTDYLENNKVFIRINLSEDNINNISKLLDIFKEHNLERKIGIGFGVIRERRKRFDTNCYINYPFNMIIYKPNFIEKYIDIVREAIIKGFNFIPILYPRPKFAPCAAITKRSYAIDPYGDIYKCWEALGLKEYSVGNIRYGIDEKKEKIWLDWTPLVFKKCVECPILPYCMGYCPAETIVKHKPEPECNIVRLNLEEYIKLVLMKIGIYQKIANLTS